MTLSLSYLVTLKFISYTFFSKRKEGKVLEKKKKNGKMNMPSCTSKLKTKFWIKMKGVNLCLSDKKKASFQTNAK